MADRRGPRERRERSEKFQTFSRPKVKAVKTSASGKNYETVKNLLSKQQSNPVVKIWKVPDQKNELAPVGSPDYPYVITTYRLTEHHLSGVMSRYLPMLAELNTS